MAKLQFILKLSYHGINTLYFIYLTKRNKAGVLRCNQQPTHEIHIIKCPTDRPNFSILSLLFTACLLNLIHQSLGVNKFYVLLFNIPKGLPLVFQTSALPTLFAPNLLRDNEHFESARTVLDAKGRETSSILFTPTAGGQHAFYLSLLPQLRQGAPALFKFTQCPGYLSRRAAVKCHKKVCGSVMRSPPAAAPKMNLTRRQEYINMGCLYCGQGGWLRRGERNLDIYTPSCPLL